MGKEIHWRRREAAAWAVQHGTDFKFHINENKNGVRVFHDTTQAELVQMMSDSAWKVVYFSWYLKKAPSKDYRMEYTVDMLPTKLMHANFPANTRRYIFEGPSNSALEKTLRTKRSEETRLKKAAAAKLEA